MAAAGLTTIASSHGPKETMNRLEAAAKQRANRVGIGFHPAMKIYCRSAQRAW